MSTEDPEAEIICSIGHESMEMKRVYQLGGIHFKGKGFFRTDNT